MQEDFMTRIKFSLFGYLLILLNFLFLTGCGSMNIKGPDIEIRESKPKFKIAVNYNNLPGNNAITFTDIFIKRTLKNPVELGKIFTLNIEKILNNKGYQICHLYRENHVIIMPGAVMEKVADFKKTKEEVDLILNVDFKDLEINWYSGAETQGGKINAQILHSIKDAKYEKEIWRWEYINKNSFGYLPGGCCLLCIGSTVIGLIPMIAYLESAGNEITQLTKGGDEMLKDYFSKLEENLPDAAAMVGKIRIKKK